MLKISAREAGVLFAGADAAQQAEFLLAAMKTAVEWDGGTWSYQAESIAKHLRKRSEPREEGRVKKFLLEIANHLGEEASE